tara:strand:+ start:143 stop:1054 length:912 start_codon:yes stop_codon:yes gene_type:complete
MITTLIFSKNRACQLDLLIRSLNKHAAGKMGLRVLYTFSDPDFGAGYEMLAQKFPEVNFIKQSSSFKKDVLEIISSSSKYVGLFTDDDIMFGGFDVNLDELDEMFKDVKPISLSLRLGRNTIIQDPYKDVLTRMPRFAGHGKFLIWDSKNVGNFFMEVIENVPYKRYYDCNFSMPVSLDGHIYKRQLLSQIVENISFYCPNSMELSMAGAKASAFRSSMLRHGPLRLWEKGNPDMACLVESIVVNSPNNKVQEVVKSTLAGEKFALEAKDLNRQFLEGKTLGLDKIYDFDIKGCHQELNLEMV